jgi:hypothetical protein
VSEPSAAYPGKSRRLKGDIAPAIGTLRPPSIPEIMTFPALFPLETIDMIIDYLHDDKLSLAACSLGCRQWLPSTRFHMFCEFKLAVDNFIQVLDVLEHPLSTITPVIQCLVICQLNSEVRVDVCLSGQRASQILTHNYISRQENKISRNIVNSFVWRPASRR